ncbi:catechol 2,3-dioxygenase-like lactoylglutathione lyase family enzyme [Bradyrhizobium sp. USDA 3051]
MRNSRRQLPVFRYAPYGLPADVWNERLDDGRTHNRTRSALPLPFRAIRAIDYTVIFVRDMVAMRRFYQEVLAFPLLRELSPDWIEYGLGPNTLALARPSRTAADAPTPAGSASLQLAFKVSAAEVDACADELARHGVALLSPPTNQSFGHRTLFFRDPDGNLLEIYAEI